MERELMGVSLPSMSDSACSRQRSARGTNGAQAEQKCFPGCVGKLHEYASQLIAAYAHQYDATTSRS